MLTCLTLNFLFDLTLKFSVYMRFVIEKYKTRCLQKPNKFKMSYYCCLGGGIQIDMTKSIKTNPDLIDKIEKCSKMFKKD